MSAILQGCGKEFTVRVLDSREKTTFPAGQDQSCCAAMESAASRSSDCRSGECGWCHSRLIAGRVFVPESADGSRMADKKFGWILPCTTYALSDVELEFFPLICQLILYGWSKAYRAIHTPAGQYTGVYKIKPPPFGRRFDFYERRLLSGACLSYDFLTNHEKVMGQTTIAASTTRK